MPLPSILIAIAAYLLGSIPNGYLLVRLFRHQDVRSIGSGNIGATNVLRSGGKGLGIATFALDVLKGCAAVWLGAAIGTLMTTVIAPVYHLPRSDFEAIAALFCVLGHIFPVWLRFKGGKGVATGFGVFLVASPLAALIAISVFILVIALTRYVSLGSIAGTLCFPVFSWLLTHGRLPHFFYAVEVVVALLIILKHHQNIARLCAGKENRFGAKQIA